MANADLVKRADPSVNFDEQRDKEKSAQLALYGRSLANACDDAEKWVRRNGELVRNEQESLLKDLRHARRILRKCEKAAGKKICAGVFGPSQAGKSYLISTLAKGESNKLWARFGDKNLDFIQEINPAGGKESTGLVTRFTMTRPASLPDGYPVQIRLLSEMDLVKIIANTYFADFEHKDKRQSNIENTLEELKGRTGTGDSHVTLDDLEDLREYLLAEFGAKAGVHDLERDFWAEAFILAPKLQLEDRVRLYSLIWDNVEGFSDLLLTLLKALASLDYAEDLFCSLEALTPREKSIIDVATLKNLGTAETDTIQVCTPKGLKTTLPRAVTTALTAELTIVMDEKPAEYFDHTDLLDFPGYRSRYKLYHPRQELEKEGMLHNLFLRGKVAYLFQRYCAERELNSMLLCIAPGNQEVQDLPGVINAWISSTHGETPEERKGKQVSLLFILTKSDEEFKTKEGEPDLSGRWDTRLNASLLNFFGQGYDWPTRWTPDRGFDNIFLLRNTGIPFEIMDHEGKAETGVNPKKEGLVKDLRTAFLGSALVGEHFRDPHKAWDDIMSLNDGGISHIRESLTPLCDPEIKRQQLLQNIESIRAGLVRRLGNFYKSDDKEELRKQKTQLAYDLWDRLYELENVKHALGELLHNFTLRDSDIYDMYPEAIKRYREYRENQEENLNRQKQEAAPAVSSQSRRNPFRDRKEQKAAEVSPTQTQLQDEESFYAAFIESKWVENLRKLASDVDAQEYFKLPAKDFSSLVGELAIGSSRLGFKDSLGKMFRDISSYANTSKDTIVRKQAAVAAQTFNDYIDLLGIHPNAKTEEERTVTSQDGETHVVFAPKKMESSMPHLEDERNPYMDDWFGDWFYALGSLIMENVNFDGKQTMNVAENTALGEILTKFRTEYASQ